MTQPSEDAVLDRLTLNRTLLARQRLLQRVPAPVAETVEHLVGMQAQVPLDPYVGLWSRLAAFDPVELEHLFLERAAVRMTLMRTTLHLVTARDAVRLRPVMQDVCARTFASIAFRRNLEGIDLAEVRARGLEALAPGPISTAELGRRLAEHWPDRDPVSLAYVVRYLVPVVQVPPRGLFGSTASPTLAPLGTWLGVEPGALTEPAPADETILRYLAAFGPSTLADIRTWSWLAAIRPVIDRLRPRLRTYRDDANRRLYDVEDGLFVSPDLPAPVRFLGEYDNLFLAHADRTRVTGEHRWGTPWVRKGAVFVDGFLGGSWWRERARDGGVLRIELLDPIHSAAEGELLAEARSLAAFLDPAAPLPVRLSRAHSDPPSLRGSVA